MQKDRVILITGTSRGIGRYLAEYYCDKGDHVVGCSRTASSLERTNYRHHCLDVTEEKQVKSLFSTIAKEHQRLDVLINNAGVASMNPVLLTPLATVKKIFDINFLGAFLFSREAAKLMQRRRFGRIVNFTTVAVPLDLEGESVYASSKSALVTLTRILARELGRQRITVNAVGPTPVKTDLIRSIPQEKIDALVRRQAIPRLGELSDISHVIDFFLHPASEFITGQVIYLGGV